MPKSKNNRKNGKKKGSVWNKIKARQRGWGGHYDGDGNRIYFDPIKVGYAIRGE